MDQTKRGRVRPIRELEREKNDGCWVSSVHVLRKENCDFLGLISTPSCDGMRLESKAIMNCGLNFHLLVKR